MSQSVNNLLLTTTAVGQDGRAARRGGSADFETQLRQVATEIDAARGEPSTPQRERDNQIETRGKDARNDDSDDTPRDDRGDGRDVPPASLRDAQPSAPASDVQPAATDTVEIAEVDLEVEENAEPKEELSQQPAEPATPTPAGHEVVELVEREIAVPVTTEPSSVTAASPNAVTTHEDTAAAKTPVPITRPEEPADEPPATTEELVSAKSEVSVESNARTSDQAAHARAVVTGNVKSEEDKNESNAIVTTEEDRSPQTKTVPTTQPHAANKNAAETEAVDVQGKSPSGGARAATKPVSPAVPGDSTTAQASSSSTPDAQANARATTVVHTESAADVQPAPSPAPSGVSATVERATGQSESAAGGTASPTIGGPRVDASRFVHRVSRAFQAAEQRGGTVQLRLSPPELGAMRIELSMHQGTLTAMLETETAAAKNILLDNLPALRERLAAQDIRVEKFEVDVRQQGSGSQPDRQERQDGQFERRRSPQTVINPQSAAKTPDDPRRSSHRVTPEGSLNVVA